MKARTTIKMAEMEFVMESVECGGCAYSMMDKLNEAWQQAQDAGHDEQTKFETFLCSFIARKDVIEPVRHLFEQPEECYDQAA